MSARCGECGGLTVKKSDGTLVIQHTDPECAEASDPELLCYQTTSMSDILVKSDLLRMSMEVETVRRDESPAWSEFHISAHIPDVGGAPGLVESDSCFMEMRGKVVDIQRVPGQYFGVTFAPGVQVWVYRVGKDDLPDQSSGVDITRAFCLFSSPSFSIWHMDRSTIEPQIHRIHKPSRRVPIRR